MIDRKALLADAQRQVRALEKDLHQQVEEVAEVGDRLRAEYDRAFRVKRTAATWSAWLDERVTQVAVAWVLGTVFVRFCEDNGLLAEPYLAGPSDERMTLAEERHEDFYLQHPHETARGWLLAAFDAIAAVPAGAALFDRRHNALYQIPVSHDAANALIAFWRRRGEDGALVHDFTDPEWDTRFLGDLYQDLSADVRKKYALLQTPEFVEEFILDLTLTPALDEFAQDAEELEEFKMIDPACGSGHFLLGAFRRLLAEWEKKAPSRDVYERVRLALDAVHGVDINPYAVAIARFRLTIAALRAAGIPTLAAAAGYTFPLHVACGDSLIKSRQLDLFENERDETAEFAYTTEDIHDHPGILAEGRYHAVVGNPPYITVKDKNLNQLYRDLYSACSGKYALSVPFAQRFFELAKSADQNGVGAGRVGQITANSFMKREFGKKLIEDFFAHQVELTHIIDTSGAYIPGHGTPTAILIGRRNRGRRAGSIRTVLGIRGEPATPKKAEAGLVWTSIVENIKSTETENSWISITDTPRNKLNHYPWNLSGGGAGQLMELIFDGPKKRLGDSLAGPIGFASFAGIDDAFHLPRHWHSRYDTPPNLMRPAITGEDVRNWRSTPVLTGIVPYTENGQLIQLDISQHWGRHLWRFKQILGRLSDFSGKTRFNSDLPWWAWYRWVASRYRQSKTITFSHIATGNHFSFETNFYVYNQHAPVIKLPEGATEDEHLRLLGVLNSSTACFWLKQVSHNKGSTVDSRGARQTTIPWEDFYEFTGTKLQEFPLPAEYPLELARELDRLAQRLTAVSPASVAAEGPPTRDRLDAARVEWESTRARMIALQEELDWQVYRQYGLLTDELTLPAEDVPELRLGERAFEIVLARKIRDGEETTEWFARHGSTPITELPAHWSAEYRALVEKRIAVIESNRYIALIERPEYKRRWATEGWDRLQEAALREWLLDRCEARELWFHEIDGMVQPRLLTTAELADELAADRDFVAVAGLYRPGEDLGTVVAELVADEHVPYLAALRYTDTGLAKRADWEHVWERQRAEDAEPDEEKKRAIRNAIPVPPKYNPKDFRKASYWRARGKLDVPKERFISYPYASRDNDPHLLLGWAGWDHREQAQALATLVVEREEGAGWPAERLVPLLAGLREVLPWVRQWHSEFDPLYDGSPADVYADFLAERMGRLHLTDEVLSSWRPPSASRGRRKKTEKTGTEKAGTA